MIVNGEQVKIWNEDGTAYIQERRRRCWT